MLKLIVFDWDGTLADSVSKITACKKALAAKYELTPPSAETVKSVLGTPFESALEKCFPTASQELLKKIGEEFHALMQEDIYQATLFPFAKEMLVSLKNKGFSLAIATSKNKAEMKKAIEYNGLENMFDLICCGKEYGEKPHPAMLKHIMIECRVTENECIMIGDTTTDMAFAKNAAVKAIAVNFGAHYHEKLKIYKPVAFLDNWKQLTGVINNLCLAKTSSLSSL